MPYDLLQDALELGNRGVRIFPVGKSKRPAIKGWLQKACNDPAQLRDWFGPDGEHRDGGIGVLCGPAEDLICFDVDFGHTDDADRREKLDAWCRQWISDQFMVRFTRSGGLHIIAGWPVNKRGEAINNSDVPRHIMPKLDVIKEGFFFVWNTAADDYSHKQGVDDIDDLGSARSEMCKQVEKPQGTAADSDMYTAEFADEVMRTDGEAGQRHLALLAMTRDWAAGSQEDSIEKMCEEFAGWFRSVYGNHMTADRMEALLEWENKGELWRAFAGIKPTPERSAHALAEAMKAKAARTGKQPMVPDPVHEQTQPSKEDRIEQAEESVGDFYRINGDELLERELESIEWLVPMSIPRGSLVSWAGPSGAGKTRYIAMLLAALMTGRTDLIGLPQAENGASTLYVANEERAKDIERRVKATMIANGLKGGKPLFVRGKEHGRFSMTRLDTGDLMLNTELLDVLVKQVNHLGIELVVFDPFVTLGSGGESDPGDIDAVNSFMTALAERTGAAVGHVHHTPKDRAAAPDAERGMDGAWRGHGSIYSALDMGDTIFPFLPYSISTDRKKRRSLMELESAGMVPRYVIVDSVKVREGRKIAPRLYELTEERVNASGQMIGVLKLEPNIRAVEDQIEAAVNGSELDAAATKVMAWAEALIDLTKGTSATLPLATVHSHMKANKVHGWSQADRLVNTRGFGKEFFNLMKRGAIFPDGRRVKAVDEGRSGVRIDIQKT